MQLRHGRFLPFLVAAGTWLAGSSARAQGVVATDLPAAAGWRAAQIHKADSGVWYAHVDKVVDAYGQNEVIAADDKGRHLVLSVYSGQWTAHSVVADGLWLAPTKSADVDPRVPGRELYAAGRAGSVHRTILRPHNEFDGFVPRRRGNKIGELTASLSKASRPRRGVVRPYQPGGTVRFPLGGPAVAHVARWHVA